MRWREISRACATFAVAALGFGSPEPVRPAEFTRIEYLGESRIEPLSLFKGTVVGGLSGITYDPARDLFLTVSDDPGSLSPSRFYSVQIDLSDGGLEQGDVELVDVTRLVDRRGRPFAKFRVEGEGLTVTPEGTLIIASEGNVDRGFEPSVLEFELGGAEIRRFGIPRLFRPKGGRVGPRHNQAFESATIDPGGRFLFTATETALFQDGPEADVDQASPIRILKIDLSSGKPAGQFLYWVEPLPVAPRDPDAFRVNGLVELLALDSHTLLALERAWASGAGNSVRIYLVDLTDVTDISDLPSLLGEDAGSVVAARKRLLLDLSDLGIRLDNLEGMTLGPDLSDGRRSLVLVSDDNFSRGPQFSQFLAFALSREPVAIHDLQGSSHHSPMTGQWIWGLEGVVTAVEQQESTSYFWMQALIADEDPATSEAVRVIADANLSVVEVGDRVAVDGRVEERASSGDLPTTSILAGSVAILARNQPLPEPVRLGRGGRRSPGQVIDDDALTFFEPEFDGIDFYESLEGMRVELSDAVVVGPTNRYGEIVVVGDGGYLASPRTAHGGLLQQPGDDNPERVTVISSGEVPMAAVGDRFQGVVEGVMEYDFGTFRLRATGPWPPLLRMEPPPEVTELRGDTSRLTVATYNVHNLDPGDPDFKFKRLAETIVRNLGAPDILALQEVQDNSGSDDDGVVAADRTYAGLIEAIRTAGGPMYDYRQIDPVDGSDGGQPGGNIRIGFLFRSGRVEFADRDSAGALDPVLIEDGPNGPRLSLNPGRISPQDPAFEGDSSLGLDPSRKSLAAEFRFGQHRLLLINNHWTSMWGDDPLFGSNQPPILHTGTQRSQQAKVITSFVEEWLSRDADASIIVLGDLNELEYRTPMRILTAGSLVNPVDRLLETDRYTFIYRGNSHMRDYVMVSPGLLRRATVRLDIPHVNADRPESTRASDHDPVLIEIEFHD